jgi:hypothetical protein
MDRSERAGIITTPTPPRKLSWNLPSRLEEEVFSETVGSPWRSPYDSLDLFRKEGNRHHAGLRCSALFLDHFAIY